LHAGHANSWLVQTLQDEASEPARVDEPGFAAASRSLVQQSQQRQHSSRSIQRWHNSRSIRQWHSSRSIQQWHSSCSGTVQGRSSGHRAHRTRVGSDKRLTARGKALCQLTSRRAESRGRSPCSSGRPTGLRLRPTPPDRARMARGAAATVVRTHTPEAQRYPQVEPFQIRAQLQVKYIVLSGLVDISCALHYNR
jgi:hypothetical protein